MRPLEDRHEQAEQWLRFDPLRRAASPRMMAAVGSLTALVEACEAALGIRRRARHRAAQDTFRCAVEAIACNLAWGTLDPLSRALTVPRDNSVLRAGGRYAHACYGQGFLDVLNLMDRPDVGLIISISLGFSYSGGSSAPSTIRPTSAFLEGFVPAGVTWGDFRREAAPEVLILRTVKDRKRGTSARLDYADTTITRRLRSEVRRVNRFLADAPFWFVDEAGPLRLDKQGAPVDPTRRTVRRIFNNEAWTEGGRLYDGTWETMRRADRFRLLRIGSAQHPEGELVCNVDFRSLNPVLCYALADLPVPDGDLYNVYGDGSCRAGFKILVNAMLFAAKRFNRMPAEAHRKFPAGTVTKDAVTAVERYHAPIAHLFWSGYGHRLANIESAILLDALANLNRQGVVALPLHDSVLVAQSEGERARQALQQAFSRFGGDHGASVTIDFGETIEGLTAEADLTRLLMPSCVSP